MPAKENNLSPLLDTQQTQLSLIMEEGASTDNKALALLAATVAVLIFMAQADLEISRWWHGVIIFGPYCLALVCIGFAIWPRNYWGATPDIDKYPENLKLDSQELVLQLLVNTSAAIKHNNQINLSRWRWCAASIGLLLSGTAILFAIL